MHVDYISHMGDDLMVVNAARVSFNKESEWAEESWVTDPFNGCSALISPKLKESDAKLIKYLASNGHWTPFSHPQICLRVSAPIFVVRQLYKHKVGFTENEVSRRYVDEVPLFYYPDEWRGRPEGGAKQGSSGVLSPELQQKYNFWYNDTILGALSLYDEMIRDGVAPEQARMILPQSMMTEFFWTGSLAAYARMCKQRLDPHAQKETRLIAEQIDKIIAPLFPVSWGVLIGKE